MDIILNYQYINQLNDIIYAYIPTHYISYPNSDNHILDSKVKKIIITLDIIKVNTSSSSSSRMNNNQMYADIGSTIDLFLTKHPW